MDDREAFQQLYQQISWAGDRSLFLFTNLINLLSVKNWYNIDSQMIN